MGSEPAQKANCVAVLCPASKQARCLWPIPEQWNFTHGKKPLRAPRQIPQTLCLPCSLRSPR